MYSESAPGVGVDVGFVNDRHLLARLGVDAGCWLICACVRLAPDGNAKP